MAEMRRITRGTLYAVNDVAIPREIPQREREREIEKKKREERKMEKKIVVLTIPR